MASSIDATKPISGNPTTASVRSNFSAAKTEIETLQGITVTAASGLTGGGTLSASFSLNVGAGTGITVNADDVAFDTTWGDARYLQGNQTITLSGDATGSGATAITVVVVDDSHAHTGSTISALDAGDTTTGTFADARISESSVTQHQTAINAGQVDGKDISVVASLPGSPDANTLYFVTT